MQDDNSIREGSENQAEDLRTPVMNVCDRCGKTFFDSKWHAYYVCDKCKNLESLCRECQENINCYCGNVMRLFYNKEK